MISCTICNKKIKPIVLLQNNNSDKGNLLKCPSCRIKFVYPQPTDQEISCYYRGMYKSHTNNFDEEKYKHAENALKKYILILKKLKEWPKENFLDLGGGLGYYSLAAENLGFDATLVDMDSVSISFAKNKLNLKKTFLGSFYDFQNSTEQKFDLILCRHVIEHFKNPEVVPIVVSELLSDNGIAIIETDNGRSYELLIKPGTSKFYFDLYKSNFKEVSYFKLFTKKPYALDPPRHLFSFSLKNLKSFIAMYNLQPIYSTTYILGDKYFWPNIPNVRPGILWFNLKRRDLKSFKLNLVEFLIYQLRKGLNVFSLGAGIQIFVKKSSRNKQIINRLG